MKSVHSSKFIVLSIKKILLIFLFLLSTINYQLSTIHAETVSSKELIEKAKLLDGKTVTYEGEVITAILNRGEYSWVNVNDGDNAIGIWCKSSLLAAVKFIGDYKCIGDMVEVEGIFHRACPVHNGELDIHADKIKVVKPGFRIKQVMSTKKINLALILFVITLSIVIIFKPRT